MIVIQSDACNPIRWSNPVIVIQSSVGFIQKYIYIIILNLGASKREHVEGVGFEPPPFETAI